MAIYRTGTASLAANGVVIGVGTKWQDKLSLIRVGATIMFPTVVGAIGTISAIVSDTELRVMTTNGAVVPAGSQYVILLHDSITVDGLAQDVAETLRYYQSKETEVADAVDFFKTFDWEQFKVVADKVTADAAAADASKVAAAGSATAAAGSATAAKTSETNAKASETAANASKLAAAASQVDAKTSETNAKTSETNAKTSETNALASKNAAAASQTAALASQNAAKTSETNAKTSETNSKTSETNAKASETAALASKNAAAASQTAAAGSATAALASQNAAKTSENNAKGYADSINPSLLLAKNQNLADVADKSAARNNLNVPFLDPQALGSVSINTITGSARTGIYKQGASANATTANGYPTATAGVLLVYGSGADGGEHTIQEYMPYNVAFHKYRRVYYKTASGWVWSDWELSVSSSRFNTLTPEFKDSVSVLTESKKSTFGVSANQTFLQNDRSEKTLSMYDDGALTYGGQKILFNGVDFGDVDLNILNTGFVNFNGSKGVVLSKNDATKPSSGIVDTPDISSVYGVNGVVDGETKLRLRCDITSKVYYARLTVTNASAGKSIGFDFNEDGDFSAGRDVKAGGALYANSSGSNFVGNFNITRGSYLQLAFEPRFTTGGDVPADNTGGRFFFEPALDPSGTKYFRLFIRRKDGNRTGEVMLNFPTTSGTIALQGTSGIEYKRDVNDADVNGALGRINSLRMVNFIYKDDEKNRVRFGVIAEEAEVIEPQYIKHNEVPYEDILNDDGEKVGEKSKDRPSVDNNPIVMDLIGCVQALTKRIDSLEAEIELLKNK